MEYQVLFSLKNIEKVFINVVCCRCDRRLKGFITVADSKNEEARE